MADRILVNPIRKRTNVSAITDGQANAARSNEKLELVTPNPFNGMQQGSVEGSYYTWTNIGTRNTGVNLTVGTGTSYAATQALCVVANTGTGPTAPDVILDSLTIKIDTAITGGTFWYLYHALDTGNRFSSGSGTIMTGYNCDGGSPTGVSAYAGVVTAAAANAGVRDVGFGLIANGILVANAIITIKYGCQEAGTSLFVTPTTNVMQVTVYAPPVTITPGNSYVLNEFQTSRSATGVGEFALGGFVR